MTDPMEQAQRALGKLWDVSDRKGISSQVVNSIGRSRRHLDGVRIASQDVDRARHFKLALDELRRSLRLVQESVNSVDQGQLADLAEVLSWLFPLEGWADANAQVPSSRSAAGADAPGGTPPEGTPGDCRVLHGLIARLAGAYKRRVVALEDPLLPWSELAAMDRTISDRLRALGWVADRALAPLDRPLGDDFEKPDDLGAFALAIHLGDASRIERALPYLEGAAVPDGPLAQAIAVLNSPDQATLDDHVHALFTRTGNTLLRAALLPVLVEHQRLSPDDLDGLLDSQEDPLATAAAEALAWVASRELGSRLLQQGTACRSSMRAHACLFAAVALGSSAAREEIRRRLQAGEVSVYLVEALAIAGDETDVARLLAVAARRGALARIAVLAAGHLGSPQLTMHVRGLDLPFLQDALACTFGGNGASATPANPAANRGRLWRGQPWSTALVLSDLSAPDTPVRVREWLALELAARTGVRPPGIYRCQSSAPAQARAAASWQGRLPRSALNPGAWPYSDASGSHRRPG